MDGNVFFLQFTGCGYLIFKKRKFPKNAYFSDFSGQVRGSLRLDQFCARGYRIATYKNMSGKDKLDLKIFFDLAADEGGGQRSTKFPDLRT